MAHTVQFEGWDRVRQLINEQQAKDLIDLLFRGEDGNFVLHGHLPDGISRKKSEGLAGRHLVEMDGTHRIHLVPENIRSRCAKEDTIGGNRKIKDPQLGAGLVLAHELQHANQSLIHKGNSSFWGRKAFQRYYSRACEREARGFADDNYALVAGTLGLQLPRGGLKVDHTEAELEDIWCCLSECDEVSLRDIVEELRESGLNNPENVRRTRERLDSAGVRVLSGSFM